ncbi:hypothetical protein B296_00019342 [Ensete ventricosum]|uniref:Uncharacterized protein n=1 Tax=Ensete ventricosum TaxID=4639 RepID=A0A427A8I3_ENSVE|nr:hypothetical protein B296_00019342 [Ensete ventricosum]
MQMEQLGIREEELAETLVRVLQRYHYPSVKVPRMRRFVIEIAMWMMNCDTKCIRVFSDLGMEKELESVSETTSELECFNVFSGSVGLSRHGTPLCSLVDAALELMATSSNSSGKKIVGYAWLSLAIAAFAPADPSVVVFGVSIMLCLSSASCHETSAYTGLISPTSAICSVKLPVSKAA